MEDFLHWAETFSELVVPDRLLDKRLLEMWQALQHGVRHYFRATHPTSGRYLFTDDTCDAAAAAMRKFADLTEQVTRSRSVGFA